MGQSSRSGRKRDPSRDVALLGAALDVLAEVGYEGLTMDAVAERVRASKATLYRRWSSKQDLLLAAIAHLEGDPIEPSQLPDTGTLRGDLLAMFKPDSVEGSEHRFRVIVGLSSLLVRGGELRAAVERLLTNPWTEAHRVLMRRAVARGEVSEDADIESVAQVLPSMAAYRTLIQQLPFDAEFLVTIVDGVLLPALHGAALPFERAGPSE